MTPFLWINFIKNCDKSKLPGLFEGCVSNVKIGCWCDKVTSSSSTHEKAFQCQNQHMASSYGFITSEVVTNSGYLDFFEGCVSNVKIGHWCDSMTIASPTLHLLPGLAWHAFYIQFFLWLKLDSLFSAWIKNLFLFNWLVVSKNENEDCLLDQVWQHDKFKPHLPPSVRACMARFLYSN